MADEKKEIEELSDEEVDDVAGELKRQDQPERPSIVCKFCKMSLTKEDLVDGSCCTYCGEQAK